MQVAAGGGGAGAGLQELAQHAAAGQEARTQAQEPVLQPRQVRHSPAQRIEYQTREYGWKIENILIFRTLLNSPLLRRKKSLLDSSEEDISEAERPRHPAPGYQNLETFQKQKLRQKVETLCGLLMSSLNCDISDIYSGDEYRTIYVYVSVII